MNNIEIRIALIENGIKHYQVAEKLGISTYTFAHWMQTELPEDKKQKILAAIKEMKEGV